ncbi:SMC-Scp complex subunit ScpB [bacterium]|nr:SMC-Scp complex subunit ScpB [bacterium]
MRKPGCGLRGLSNSAKRQLDSDPTGAGWRWAFLNRRTTASTSLLDIDEQQHPIRRSARMARVEAVLLVAEGALTYRKLAQFATLADAAEAKSLIDRLNAAYDVDGCAFRIEQVAGGYRLMTRPQFALWLDRLHNRQARTKLSPPMMETLSIVAYRQPVTRAEIEKIRGVQSSEMLKHLMDRGLVRITGEEDSLGRPFLYGTTRQFLEEFGLGKLDDLPMAATLRRVEEPVSDDQKEEADNVHCSDEELDTIEDKAA